jgi:single-strand DNA-binding protein
VFVAGKHERDRKEQQKMQKAMLIGNLGRDPEAFGRRAEVVGEHLRKGSRVYLEGRKHTESWDDKQTGGKRYRDLVYADRVEFLDVKGSGNGHRKPSTTAYDETTMTDQAAPF